MTKLTAEQVEQNQIAAACSTFYLMLPPAHRQVFDDVAAVERRSVISVIANMAARYLTHFMQEVEDSLSTEHRAALHALALVEAEHAQAVIDEADMHAGHLLDEAHKHGYSVDEGGTVHFEQSTPINLHSTRRSRERGPA